MDGSGHLGLSVCDLLLFFSEDPPSIEVQNLQCGLIPGIWCLPQSATWRFGGSGQDRNKLTVQPGRSDENRFPFCVYLFQPIQHAGGPNLPTVLATLSL